MQTATLQVERLGTRISKRRDGKRRPTKAWKAHEDIARGIQRLIDRDGYSKAVEQLFVAPNTLTRLLHGRGVHLSTIRYVDSRLAELLGRSYRDEE